MTQVSASIIATTQTQQIESGVVELYQLKSPKTSDPILYFHAGVNEDYSTVQFRDSESPFTLRDYNALPLYLEKSKLESDGATNRPTLTVANVLSVFSDALGDFKYKDLIGYSVIMRTTLEEHLSSGSATSAPTEFPQVSYIIDRVAQENNASVTFELTVPFDLENVKIPRRVLLGKYCNWQYKGIEEGKGGGCTWKCERSNRAKETYARNGTNILAGNQYTEFVYLNGKDEFIIPNTLSTYQAAWNAETEYDKGALVSFDNKNWMAEKFSEGADPEDESGYWSLIHFYSIWATNVSYSIGDYVKDGDKAWICTIAHTGHNNKRPSDTSPYWNYGDVCGKTLRSCTRRFNSSIKHWPPRSANGGSIPFGAFPGSDVYK